jgi:hypothetical protein
LSEDRGPPTLCASACPLLQRDQGTTWKAITRIDTTSTFTSSQLIYKNSSRCSHSPSKLTWKGIDCLPQSDRTTSLTFSVSPIFNPTTPKRSLSTTPSKCNAHHAVKCTPTGSQSTVMYETYRLQRPGFGTLTPLS